MGESAEMKQAFAMVAVVVVLVAATFLFIDCKPERAPKPAPALAVPGEPMRTRQDVEAFLNRLPDSPVKGEDAPGTVILNTQEDLDRYNQTQAGRSD